MVKLVLIALICGFLCVYLKEINSNLFALALISSGLLIVFFSINYIGSFLEIFNQLVDLTGVDKELINVILKITAIGYLIEFCSGTLEDMGLKSLSDKFVFVGKLIIVITAMPIIYAVFNLIKGLLI